MKAFLGADDRSEIFCRYLKGRCHGNQFSGKNGTKLPPLHLSLSMQNGMGYRPANVHIYSDTNCCTWCENMVKIG